jgi:flavin-dependent dehydrogenase
MSSRVDALVIGGGPAGTSSAIFLALAGWRVLLVEQSIYPRQKVCGECLSAASLALIDQLGIGEALGSLAGPELSRVGWLDRGAMLDADFPRCTSGAYPYGRAIGRDRLDHLLIERARELGVEIAQPAKVRRLGGGPGEFEADLVWYERGPPGPMRRRARHQTRLARTVIDAHGSWEPAPTGASGFCPSAAEEARPSPKRCADLFAFKASFAGSALAPGMLPVISLDGGYGGMVVAEGGRTTLACCIRRDRLHACRRAMPGAAAGAAVAKFLRGSCPDVERMLSGARQIGPWLSVGPLRPGIRVGGSSDVFRVGNAAGECHPLVGEGISMALQGGRLLAACLTQSPAERFDASHTRRVNRCYAQAWRQTFAGGIRFAALAAHASMHPAITTVSRTLLSRHPHLLTRTARWAGKANPAPASAILNEERT